MKYSKNSSFDLEPDRCPSCGEKHLMDEEDFDICIDCSDTIAEWQEMYREMGILVDDELNIIGTHIDIYEDENDYRHPIMKHYKADISVKRVGITTAPKIRLTTQTSDFQVASIAKSFPAPDIAEARQRAITLVKNPSTPEFQKCLDFYCVPFKSLEWGDWTDPIEPEGSEVVRSGSSGWDASAETQIHSCSSHPFLVGVFTWVVQILVYEA